MANISAELAAIQSAIYGRDVRGSIHNAIRVINDECEKIFLTGTTDPTGNADFSKLLYLNTNTWDLFVSSDTTPYTWNLVGNIEGNAITSITGPDPDPDDPLRDIYTINFSKIPDVEFAVENGKGIVSIVKTQVAGLVDTYTITYTDGTTQDYDVTNGKGIVSIVKTQVAGLVDTYTITYIDGTTQDYDVNNGKGIVSITGPDTNVLTDTYTITYNDGTTQTYDVKNGKGITSINGPVSSGLVDMYTIVYNDGSTQNYTITNGKDGNTVLRGTEVTGVSTLDVGFTLNRKCQTGDTYINNNTGNVYECRQGAEANVQSLWKFSFAMTGGGGAQWLYDLTDVNDATVMNPQPGYILQYDANVGEWVGAYGGSGHNMRPVPDASKPSGLKLTEDDVVAYVKSKFPQTEESNQEVASIFSIAHWSNVKRIRLLYTGTIGHTGIGIWKDGPIVAADEEGWWENDAFKMLDTMSPTVDGYDIDFDIKFDPGNGEPITLGGYIIDTTTGKMCIRFANYVADPARAKVAVDITITRTNVG